MMALAKLLQFAIVETGKLSGFSINRSADLLVHKEHSTLTDIAIANHLRYINNKRVAGFSLFAIVF